VETNLRRSLRVRHQTQGFKSSSCKDRNCWVCSAVLPTMHLPVSDQEFGLVFRWHPRVWAHLRKAPLKLAQVGPTSADAAKADGKDSQKWSLPLICHSFVCFPGYPVEFQCHYIFCYNQWILDPRIFCAGMLDEVLIQIWSGTPFVIRL